MNAAAPALIALIAALSGDGQPCLPEANRAVVAFARQAIGAPVGDGSCTALVAKAYRDADLTIERADEEIRWGRPVAKRADWLAGDVLEFRDVVFAGRRRKQRDGADGVGSYRLKMEKHTAIVDEVRDGGRVIVVLHQNVGPDDAP